MTATNTDYDPASDILYGAAAIARWLYGNDDEKFCKRAYNLASLQRPGLGFFKVGSVVCLSKSQFLAYVKAGGKFKK